MKTRKDVVLEWCRENKIKYLTHHSASDMDCSHIYGVVKEEDVKNVIGGFDDEQNYHKLPADIFKVKVTKSIEAYVSDSYFAALTSGTSREGIFVTLHENSLYPYEESEVKKVTITWEEEEEIE